VKKDRIGSDYVLLSWNTGSPKDKSACIGMWKAMPSRWGKFIEGEKRGQSAADAEGQLHCEATSRPWSAFEEGTSTLSERKGPISSQGGWGE